MTKRISTLFMAVLFLSSAFAQNVEEVQRTVLTKRTATWCSLCGGYGWTMMDGLVEDNADRAIIIAAHESSSNLGHSNSEELTANWGTMAQPSFFVNEVKQTVTSSNIAQARADIKAQVDAAFASQPVVNVGFDPVFSNGEIKVDAKVEFFQQASGDYYLGIYLLEDNVMANQSGSVADDIHKRVLQYSFTDNTWGLPITNGNVAAGTTFDLSYSLPISGVDGYDYHVAGIIFELDGGVYKPVNAWSTTQIDEAVSTDEVADAIIFQVNPTIVENQATIQLEMANSSPEASIDVIDLNGKSVQNIHRGTLSAGNHSFDLWKENLASGIYFVRLTNGEEVSTQRVVFQ